LAGVLSTPELHTLIARILQPVKNHPAFVWAWSHWRLAHQIAAALAHRKRRNETQL